MDDTAFASGIPVSGGGKRCQLHRDRGFLCENRVRDSTRCDRSLGTTVVMMSRHGGHDREKGGGWWRRVVGTMAVAGVMIMGPGSAEARWGRGGGKGVVMDREEETEFVLPSQRAAMQREMGRQNDGGAMGKWGKRIGMVGVAGLAVGGVVQTGRVVNRRWQKRKLKEFQKSMGKLGMESLMDGLDGRSKSVKARADAKSFLAKGQRKYQFKTEEKAELQDMASKVQLDLFKSGRAGSSEVTEETRKAQKFGSPVDGNPKNDFERASLQAIKTVEDGGTAKDAVSKWLQADAVESLNNAERRALFNSYASRLVSATIDKAGALIDSDSSESLKTLTGLVKRMAAVRGLSQTAGWSGEGLFYLGVYADSVTVREELYRRYAVFCLSTEERVKENFQSLIDMQQLLSVTNERAEVINTEIAKGMFQIAVSAAMADGNINEESRATLDKLKDSFGDFLDTDSADSIMSEVSVMRAMYALQALLKEQGVSEEDVTQLRTMCSELGVDIDEMMQNADALGAALGPEAKQFVESLRTLLANPTDASGAIDVTKDATPPELSSQAAASISGDSSSAADPSASKGK